MSQHYYNFTFIYAGENGLDYGHSYLGIDTQQVTLAMVEVAKKHAKVGPSATLLSCSYLGYMTKEQFNAPL